MKKGVGGCRSGDFFFATDFRTSIGAIAGKASTLVTAIDLTGPLNLPGAVTTMRYDISKGEIGGLLDDGRVYADALTTAKVQALYNLGAPVNHLPADGVREVAIDTNLSWTANPLGDGGSYDVYLGTAPGALALVSPSESGLSYDPSADLGFDTTYYWRVDGVETGHVLSFTTALPPCSITAEEGDLNGDCLVTLEDFAILANNWLLCGWEPASLCP